MKISYRRRTLVRGTWFVLLALTLIALVSAAVRLLADVRYSIALIVLLGIGAVATTRLRRRVPRRTVLEIDFERGIVEQVPPDPIGRLLASRSLVLRDVVEALQRAGGDPRVTALVARIGPVGLGLAHAQELRDAITAFRQTGKRAVAYAETFGDGTTGTVEYYLATAFDEIHLLPAGDVEIVGLLRRRPFLRGLFDKLGIAPAFDHRHEYKSAKYLLTESEMVEPQRKAETAVLDSQFNQIVAGIAESRRLHQAAVRALIDRSPLLAVEALEAGLVDSLAYRDEVYERVKESGELLFVDVYLKRAGRPHRKGPTIAVIYGNGAVTRGRRRFSPLTPGFMMASDAIGAAFRQAVEDRKVRAIVFRIESPGGSATASEVIWRAIEGARRSGKPVIASLGNVAASGGYYVAAGANKIVAQPGTITGSIGVIWGKLVTHDAWQKAGVNWDHVSAGANAAHWSPDHDFSEVGWERLQALLDHVYSSFKEKVALGRSLEPDQVETAARGRIWTGEAALEHGLIDELGGLAQAVEMAKVEAAIAPDHKVRLRDYPKRRRLLMRTPVDSSETVADLVSHAVATARPLSNLASSISSEERTLLSDAFVS